MALRSLALLSSSLHTAVIFSDSFLDLFGQEWAQSLEQYSGFALAGLSIKTPQFKQLTTTLLLLLRHSLEQCRDTVNISRKELAYPTGTLSQA
jgi:hypothetical protein